MSTKYTFEQYRSIFDEAIRKYEGNKFFADLKQQRGLPDFPSDPDTVAIVGIRHEGKKTHFREDTADDTIALVRIDGRGNKLVSEYVGTTEPGLFSGGNAMGVFKLSPGFYYFKLGKHHGVNPCLVQDCAVLGERAKEGKDWDETDEQTWQITDGSLHIHAGVKNINHVGNWSAGCTVIAGGWEGNAWAEFFGACRKAANFPIPYVLVREADIPELLASAQSRAANGSNGSHAAAVAAPQPVTVDGGGGVSASAAAVATLPDEVRVSVAPPVPTAAPPTPAPATPAPTVAPPAHAAAQESSAEVVQASAGSSKRTTATIAGVAVAAVAGIKGFLDANPVTSALIIIAVVAAVIWLITWYIHVQRDLDKKRMELAADPDKKNVR